MSIPVIVIARNNLALTKKTLASVLRQDTPVEVLVVENHSSDGSAAWLRTKPVTTIFAPEQWSLAKCWNTALKALWKAGWKEAVVVNNDIILREDACRLLSTHGGEFVTCVSVSSEDQLGTPGDRSIESLRASERPHPDFSAWLIRKSVTDRGLWFNEDCFPAYLEDNFGHVAMHQAGVKAVCIDLPFVHFSASTLKAADPGEAARIRRGADANRALFKKKYGCVPGTKEYEALFTTPPAPEAAA